MLLHLSKGTRLITPVVLFAVAGRLTMPGMLIGGRVLLVQGGVPMAEIGDFLHYCRIQLRFIVFLHSPAFLVCGRSSHLQRV